MALSSISVTALSEERESVAAPLVEVTRGEFVESVHRGHAVVVDGAGRVIKSFGSREALTLIRSAAKPFQALPLITTGAADSFGLTPGELAVACGSHDAERIHTKSVISMLEKAGLSISDLKCGPHEPYGKLAARELRERGLEPSAIHNNCSGKHAGMLVLARHLGTPVESYDRPGSPVQREVFAAVSRFSGLPVEGLRYSVDGCGLPTFALTIETMARMFACLVAPPAEFGEGLRDASGRIIEAMTAHPEMVEGEGELDTELMRAGRGRFVSKVGAEGIYAAGVLPSEVWPKGLGIAFKIEDGDRGDRARPVAAVALLRALSVIGDDEMQAVEKFARSTLTNRRGEDVGEVRPASRLISLKSE